MGTIPPQEIVVREFKVPAYGYASAIQILHLNGL